MTLTQSRPCLITVEISSGNKLHFIYSFAYFYSSRLDYEGFLIANVVCKGRPSRQLDALMAIKAFDAETATIAHSVKTPEAAAIRYEFWRIGSKKIKSKEAGK